MRAAHIQSSFLLPFYLTSIVALILATMLAVWIFSGALVEQAAQELSHVHSTTRKVFAHSLEEHLTAFELLAVQANLAFATEQQLSESSSFPRSIRFAPGQKKHFQEVVRAFLHTTGVENIYILSGTDGTILYAARHDGFTKDFIHKHPMNTSLKEIWQTAQRSKHLAATDIQKLPEGLPAFIALPLPKNSEGLPAVLVARLEENFLTRLLPLESITKNARHSFTCASGSCVQKIQSLQYLSSTIHHNHDESFWTNLLYSAHGVRMAEINGQDTLTIFDLLSVPGSSWILISKLQVATVLAPVLIFLRWMGGLLIGTVLVLLGISLKKRKKSEKLVKHTLSLAERLSATVPSSISGADPQFDALNHMHPEIRRIAENTATKTWLARGRQLLADALRGELSPHALAEELVRTACIHLQTKMGLFYLLQDNTLILSATYSYADPQGFFSHIPLDTGMSGQAARERRILVFSNPQGPLPLYSEGQTQRRLPYFLAVPLVSESVVHGVLLLGADNPFTDLHVQMAEIMRTQGACFFNTVRRLTQTTATLEAAQASIESLRDERQTLQKERTRLLSRMASLESADKSKSEFLANVSHELRTPLNSILILSQILEQNKEGTLTTRQKESARTIHSSGTDLLQLINEILDLSKVESGHIEFFLENISLKSILADQQRLFQDVAQEKGLEFTIEHSPDVPEYIISDRQRLQQVLRNLLANAFKFTSSGGITLRLFRPEPETVLSTSSLNPEDSVAFSVEDMGIGIPAHQYALIFEPFHQVDSSNTRKYGGTGLGLSISKKLVTLLGGEIQLRSHEGVGSTFTCFLPIEHPQAETPRKSRRTTSGTKTSNQEISPAEYSFSSGGMFQVERRQGNMPLQNKTLLLVDDDMRSVFALSSIFEEQGAQALLARDGRECLEKLTKIKRVDAILMDIMMPEMNGYEAIQAIRQKPEYSCLPIIALTAKAMSGDREEALNAGATEYLTKPVDMAQLFSVLSKLLRRS